MEPRHADALHMLGVIAGQTGRKTDAVDWLRRSVGCRPDHPEAQKNLGVALKDAGHLDEAITAYRRAATLKPDYAEAHRNLGNALFQNRKFEEAITAYRTALHLSPDFATISYNLGIALRIVGQHDEAITAFREALRLRPDHVDTLTNLGHALKEQCRTAEAIAAYRDALRLKPDSPDLQHVLAALTGDHSQTTTPATYVRNLFDPYAAEFDGHLVGQLNYGVPGQLLEAVVALAPGRRFDTLDLGCGTGLCGLQFRAIAKSLTGVDLSPAMTAKAETRGIYDRLVTSDVTAAMREHEDAFDLILAGDVFVYVGDLGQVFHAAACALRSTGLFAFSIEHLDGDGFALHPKVRFAHSLAYIRGLSRTHAFAELHVRAITVRKSGADDVPGWIVVLQKAG